jgi:transposase
VQGKIDPGEAAARLGRSVRQVYRMKAKARRLGASYLTHGNRGKIPANKISAEVRDEIVAVVQDHYTGLSHSELQEILSRDHGISVGRESLRKMLRAAGIPSKRQTARD